MNKLAVVVSFLISAGFVGHVCAETSVPLPVAPVSQWKVSANPGDVVRLSDADGILSVSYDAATAHRLRTGAELTPTAVMTLELGKPVTLQPEQIRVLFETRIVESTGGAPVVRPLVENEKGERFSYVPWPQDAIITPPEKAWKAWRTTVLQATEAGGSASGIYEVVKGGGNASALGALRFVGLEIRIAANGNRRAAGRVSGRLLLENLSLGGLNVSEFCPVYADALLKDKGSYQIALETRAAFQGIPFAEADQTITFDPASESSRRQPISIPLGTLHNNWVRYRITEASGRVVADQEMRWERNLSPQDQKYPAGVDVSKAPRIGLVRINPERSADTRRVGGVYQENEPFKVTFRTFPADAEKRNLKLKWTVTPYAFETPLQQGEETVRFRFWRNYVDTTVDLRKFPERNAYRIRYVLADASGKQMDAGEYTLGIARREITPHRVFQGHIPDRNEIKKYPYFHTSFNQPDLSQPGLTPPQSEKQALENFKEMLGSSKQMTPRVSYRIDLADFEILPGVFDFVLLDQVMDTAQENGCTIAVRVAHSERYVPFRWHPYTHPRNFDGTILYGHRYYGSYSLTDPEHVEAWKRAFRALHSRYGRHAGFEGYYLLKPSGEWIIPDKPWNGEIADYSWSATEAFRKYLKEDLGLDLAKLNARWGTSYSKWEEVLPPQPNFQTGTKPDLRPQWIDYCRCKLTWNNDWAVQMSKDIRSYDPSHLIIVYVRLMEEDLDKLAGLIDYQHNGGQYGFEAEGRLVDAWEKHRIGWITEPYWPRHWARERDGWVLDWSVYVMLSQAGGGGANLHVSYFPNPTYSLAAHYGSTSAYDRYELFKPVLQELHGMKLNEEPKQVAVIQDMDTLFEKHRSIFRARLLDLCRGFDLLKMDSVDFEYYRPENEKNYKMVVLNFLDQVISPSTLDTVERMVNNGALLVMTGLGGQYCSGLPGEEFPLLKRLGIKPPEKAYDTLREKVSAPVVAGSPLGGGLSRIRFYSQADFRRDLHSPEVDYLNWIYRWLPDTDYFGYFPGHTRAGGETLARFADGGAAVSLYKVGKGRVLVFWGTPDLGVKSRGLMETLAGFAGVGSPRKANPIPHMLEGRREDMGRYYAIPYQENIGTYTQKISHIPDGDWFIDDMVSGERYGYVNGKTLREKGITLSFTGMSSPLKVLRFIPRDRMEGTWPDLYPRKAAPAF